MAKSLIILSHKSCGSSVLLRLLASSPGVRTIEHTRHYQHESLYWTKAASVLGLPQSPMHASEVPIPAAKAKRDLLDLLSTNAPMFTPPQNDEALVFEGWRALCEAHAPVFVEKSPHHLYQRSCLDLMRDAAGRTPEIEFHFVGLIRNPMDMVYSQWRRWRAQPERTQQEWLVAYRNLLDFEARMGRCVTRVRYEDLVRDADAIRPVLEFCGARPAEAARSSLHDRSVAKWRSDGSFGFRLADEVLDLARTLGYSAADLPDRGPSAKLWPLVRSSARIGHGLTAPVRGARKLAARLMRGRRRREAHASNAARAGRPSASMQTFGPKR